MIISVILSLLVILSLIELIYQPRWAKYKDGYNLVWLVVTFFGFCVLSGCSSAGADPAPQPPWHLTVQTPVELVTIDAKGLVTIHGDVHSRQFWEKVAAAFKEDCPPSVRSTQPWIGLSNTPTFAIPAAAP